MNSRISRKTQKKMFLLVSGGHQLCPLKGRSTWRLYTKPFKFGKTFFRISRIWIIAQTWFLARLLVHLSSFISQILDFLHGLVCIFIFDGVTVNRVDCVFARAVWLFWSCWQITIFNVRVSVIERDLYRGFNRKHVSTLFSLNWACHSEVSI